ncbi:MAG: prepilin-type N-terminal cleavage/methylation domain-containing protein [Bdellovibrionaceae bacterium]|nr:prepilin-type N-terminal cleavage/methylation domain-containing protein [Pseudobdellovibrionaceae bacterium]
MAKIKKKSFLGRGGFTMVELMLVVAIGGTLSTMAVSSYKNYQARARQQEARYLLSIMYTAQLTYHAQWGIYFGDFANIGYAPSDNLHFRVGFTGVGPTNQVGYQGPGTGAGVAANPARIHTGGALACEGGPCGESPYGLVFPPITLGNVTWTTFVAEAVGDVDGEDAVWDQWTINHQKVLTNVTPDI